MFCGITYPLHLDRYLPRSIRSLGWYLELLLEIFLYIVTTHIAIFYMYTIYLNYDKGNLDLLADCLIQTIIYLWATLMKLYFRRIQPKRLEDLIDFINLNYRPRSAKGFTYVTMDNCLAMSNKYITTVCSCFLGAIFLSILPIANGDRSLPLTCWYPFDYKKPIIYETMYFLQFLGQLQVASAFSVSSGFHMMLGILISGQYDILFCSLKNLLATVAIDMSSTKQDLRTLYELQESAASELNQYYCSIETSCDIETTMKYPTTSSMENSIESPKTFRYYFRNTFKNCVDHHRCLMECMRKMENFYSSIWFFKTGEVVFLMCLVAFVSVKSTTENSSFMKVLSLGQYLILVAMEFFIICYFGEILYLNSQRCGEAILRSPWYIHMNEMKNDFQMFLLNSNQPFQLTAGKIYALNVDQFKSIMTTAFSFLTLLQNMDQRN